MGIIRYIIGLFVFIVLFEVQALPSDLTIAATDATEDVADGLFTITTTNQFTSPVLVDITVSGTATEGTDYTTIGTQFIFPANQSTYTLPVTILTDNLVEGDETITVTMTLTNNVDVTILTPAATVTITDDDLATLSIAATTSPAGEDATDGLLTITTTKQFASSVTVDITVSGTATAGTDYATIGTSVVFPANQNTVTIPIDVTADDLVEGDETVVVTMTGTDNAAVTISATDEATVTITDDDLATLSIAATTSPAGEDATDGLLTITTTKQFASSVTVDITVSGTATAGTDYATIGTSVVFPANQNTVTIPIDVTADDLVEGDETVVVTMTGTDNAAVTISATDEATVTITDDDLATLSIAATISPAGEDATDGLLTITTTKQFASSVTVDITVSGTATAGTDYATIGTSVVFPANQNTVTIPIDVTADDLVEGDETVVVTMTGTDNAAVTISATEEATVTIADDDLATLSIATTTQATEDATDGLLTITTTKQFASSVTVDITVSGTATAGTDYATIGTSVLFPANQNTVTIPIDVTADDLVEGDETVVVTMTGTDNAAVTISATEEATVTITDDDLATLSIATTTQATEDATDGLLTITTTKQFASSVTVDITVSGTATAGTDYATIGTSVVFPANQNTVTIPIDVTADDLVEGDETVVVTMTGTDNAAVTISATDEATVTIADDDVATLSIATTTQATEDATDGLLTITTTKQFASSVTVDITVSGTATAGTDYATIGTSVVFPANQNTVTIPIDVTADDLVEGDETVVVTMTGTDNAAVTISATEEATVTITDDDLATLSIVATTQAAEDATDGLLTITTTKQFASSVTVDITVSGTATAGTDYATIGTSVLFPANQNTVTIPIDVTADDLVEGDETVVVTMTGTDNAAVTISATEEATVTITDDDLATLSIATTTQATEDATDGLLTITTTKQFASSVTVDITVSGTATAGTDYATIGTSVLFPANQNTVTIPIDVTADDLVEGDETVVVTMTGTDNAAVTISATDEATVTIADDDVATLSIATTTQATEDATDGLLTITTTKQFASSVTVDITVSGTATAGTDYATIGTSVVFPANQNTVTIPIDVTADDLVEGDETVVVTMTGTDNAAVTISATEEATVTITDDDLATLSIVATTQAAEDATDGLLTITTTKQFASSVTVDITVSGTATAGTDYATIGTSVLFPANQNTVTIPIDVTADDLVEGDETVVVTMTGTDNAAVTISATEEATVTIADDDLATLSIATTTQATEDATDGLLTITTTKQFASSVTVDITVSGTATAGTDYATIGTSVLFPANQNTVTIPIDVTADDLVEGDETVVVTMTGTDNAAVTISATDEATVTIADDDLATLSIAATISPAGEDATDGLLTITTTKQFASSVTVDITVSGTATAGTDYATIGTSVVFPANQNTVTIPIDVTADDLVEGDETVVVTMTGTDNAAVTISATDEATVTITDDDLATLSIATTISPAGEDATDGLLTITTTKQFASSVTVDITVSGTATAGTDYATIGTSVLFPANQNTVTIPIDVTADDLVEGDETVVVTMTGTDNAAVTISATDEATVTIADDDVATLSIVVTTQATEDATDGLLTITTTKQFASSVTVDITVSGTATAGTDYATIGTSVLFPANQNTVTIPIDVTADDLVEGDETVVVTMTGTDNAAVTISATEEATVTITDDDLATLSIATTTQATEDATDGLLTITTTKQFASSVTVDITVSGTATAGTDYATIGTSVLFPANQNTVTIPIDVTADDLVEGDETVVVTMTGTDNAAVTISATEEATVTITDDDLATLSIATTTQATEDATDGLLTITTTKQFASSVTVDITVSGTATAGTDYATIGTSVLFPANQNTVTIPIDVTADDLVEGDETVVVTMTGTDNAAVTISATDEATVTIADDDVATLSIATTTQATEDATDGLLTITTTKQFASSVTVDITVSGTATAGTDYATIGTSVVFPANQNTVTIPIDVTADDLVEGDETVVVTMTGTDNAAVTISATEEATVTITDDDLATLSIVATTQAAEDATDGLFTITTSKQFDSSVIVDITIEGTATSGTDYTTIATQFTFPSNQSSFTIPVNVLTDAIIEGDETIIITITGTNNSDVSGGTSNAATITITDNDIATLSILATTQAQEDATDGLFTITTSKQFIEATNVAFTVSGTAGEGVDFLTLDRSIEFPAFTNSVSISLPVVSDNLVESDETVTITITSADNVDVIVGSTNSATITITDDDLATLSIVSTTQATEGVTDGLFTITTTKQFASPVLVDITVGGTATSGIDYSAISTQFTFPANQSDYTIPVSVMTDNLVEGDETVVVTMTGTNNGDVTISATDEATITITDDDVAELTILATTQATEDLTDGLFTITTTKAFSSAVTVNIGVTGTATSGADYISLGTSFDFPANSLTTTLPLTVASDDLVEADEAVIVTMTGTNNGAVTISATDEATITITDDDQATLSILATTQATEDVADGLFTITTTKAFSSAVMVNIGVTGIATSVTDYSSLGTSFDFPANSLTTTLPLTVASDDLVEADETVIVTMTGTNNGDVMISATNEATITITNDDIAALSIVATTQAGEDATDGLFTISSTNQFSSSVTVDITITGGATEGIDYTSIGTQFTFPSNQSTFILPVSVLTDELVEADETVVVTLVGTDNTDITIGTTDAATITITDNDVAELTIAATAQAAEDVTDGFFTITSSKQMATPQAIDFALSGTATSGDDFTDLGTSFVFPANQNTTTIPVEIVADDLNESDETVILTLTGTPGSNIIISSPDNAIITITDDDEDPVITPSQVFNVNEDDANTTTIGTVMATDGNPGTSFSNWMIASGNTSNIFTINASTGELSVSNNTSLDYETVKAYSLTVRVGDGTNLSAPEILTINVQDANDNSPEISSGQSFTLDETSLNSTVVGAVIATDFDTNTVFENWTIVSGNTDDIFGIDGSTGELIVIDNAKLDYESRTSYDLVLRVSDGINLSPINIVTVEINNIIDEIPIVNPGQAFSLNEDAVNGFLIGTLSASTSDIGSTLEDWIITGGDPNSVFSLNSLSGELTVLKSSLVDFELNEIIELSVTVSSGMNTSVPEIITININDVNDEIPIITGGQNFSINENAIANSVVGTINVSDGDANTIFSGWTITAGNIGNAFSIGSNSGQLLISGNINLDFETRSTYTLEVTVSDGVNVSSVQSVQIAVNDLNDEFPLIIPNQSFQLAESATLGSSIGDIIAQDADANTNFTGWLIKSGNEDNVFALNENTGELTVNDTILLNYEYKNVYTLGIGVADGVNVSPTVAVRINVLDINDPPKVIYLDDTTINAYDPVNTVIGMLSTLDEDNTQHTYSVIGNEAFTIDDNFLLNNLVFTNKNDSSIILTLRSEDAGGASLEKDFEILVYAPIDSEVPQISNVSQPGIYEKGSGPITIEATITDFALEEVLFYYRKLTDENYTSNLVTSTTDAYVFEIPEDSIGEVGLEYYFQAKDESGNQNSSEKFKISISFPNAGENVPELLLDPQRFGQDIRNYQVVSIPYVLDENDSRIDVIFDEYGGNPDNLNWRMLRFDNNTQKIEDINGSYQVKPGEGYFFIAKKQEEVKIENAATNIQDSITITLKKDWNLIGNPYNIDINWPSVLASNLGDGVGPIRVIDPADPAAWPEGTTLKAFEGAFVFALEDVELNLVYQNAENRIIDEYPVPDYTWYLPLTLNQATSKQKGGVGMHKDALPTFDRYDSPALPRWLEYLELNFAHPEHSYGKMSRDIVNDKPSHVWEFKVSSNLDGPAILNWPVFSEDIEQLVLIDLVNNQMIDMKEVNQYQFELIDHRSFKICYSKDPHELFLSDHILVKDVYPNPATRDFTIPMILPKAEHSYKVSVKLFDMLGKELQKEVHQLAPGNHELNISVKSHQRSSLMIYELEISNDSFLKRVQDKIIINYE